MNEEWTEWWTTVDYIEKGLDNLLAEEQLKEIFKNTSDPCKNCPNNRPGKINICYCTLGRPSITGWK